MTKKFTEEQYNGIVKSWRDGIRYVSGTEAVMNYLEKNNVRFMGEEALAVANPLTRKWAHEKFVEKEKRYIWTSQHANIFGRHKRLYWHAPAGSVREYFTIDEHASDESELLTESEIKEWGYNPEAFDREEV